MCYKYSVIHLEVDTLANKKSAEKRVSVSMKKRLVNSAKKSSTRKQLRDARLAIENDSPDKKQLIMEAMKAVDKAASDGIIHRNKAARHKSKLSVHLK
jgi:small subunit ribosomal protein S20